MDWALPPLVGGKWDSLFLTTTLTNPFEPDTLRVQSLALYND